MLCFVLTIKESFFARHFMTRSSLCCSGNHWPVDDVCSKMLVGGIYVLCTICTIGTYTSLSEQDRRLSNALWVGIFPARQSVRRVRSAQYTMFKKIY